MKTTRDLYDDQVAKDLPYVTPMLADIEIQINNQALAELEQKIIYNAIPIIGTLQTAQQARVLNSVGGVLKRDGYMIVVDYTNIAITITWIVAIADPAIHIRT